MAKNFLCDFSNKKMEFREKENYEETLIFLLKMSMDAVLISVNELQC